MQISTFRTIYLQCNDLTDDKLHGEQVCGGYVGTVEDNLDLELLSSTDEEMVRVEQHGVVFLLVALIRLPHHVHLPNVQILWIGRKRKSEAEEKKVVEKCCELTLT